jgi:ribosomal protein S18 acetylase RimI-like enzyme
MIDQKQQIYELATALFAPAEWPFIESSLDTCLHKHSQTLFDEGACVAFVIVNRSEDGNAFISYCGVSPSHQGKGYGSKLLKMAIHSIFQVDFPAIQLYVDTWNKDARRLYDRLGFKQVGSAVVAGSACALMELRCPMALVITKNEHVLLTGITV